ncbi:MAG: glycoside hydrolase family 68 protein [Tessaracoccus sp.]|uniref:glycoside hydrolase family 68 protein n=1 Tax=Tessaracoccus sp. TaxID=1971211 RepID=UPI001EBCDB2B|nr:glycoside hydrolase family 68 protein [Tessaracoccus sp.]MBK7821218.1 glycoside hydrolase family 68 protein [Tessaracoccus sp.]
MTLRLKDRWIWDSWPFTDGQGSHHLFYLQADRSLSDPDLRHWHPSIGHAVSTDYRNWTVLPDVIAPSETPAWDDCTTWTGSVVQGPTGRYHLFYTGTTKAENGMVQRIGRADSDDLIHWERFGDTFLLEADSTWYERYSPDVWHDEAFRDPWVMKDPEGDGWHMLITARSPEGSPQGRGVIGHAWSPDLDTWEVRPPLSTPGGFGQMEVLQYLDVDGVPTMVFCSGGEFVDPAVFPDGAETGVWVMQNEEGLFGRWNASAARRIAHESLYAARVVRDVDGAFRALGFCNEVDGAFVGEILEPVDLLFD